jgi:hypothetical protein
MNFMLKKMLGNFSVAERLATSQEGFSSMKLDGWMDGWMNGWMGGWMVGWVDGSMD